MGTALDTLKKWSSLLEYNLPNLVLLDAKFPRQIFYFAKCVFPFSNYDAVFTFFELGAPDRIHSDRG